MTKEKQHARLSASGSATWLNCPGSVKAQEAIEKGGSSFYADEGTLAHELADMCLKNRVDASEYLGKTISCERGREILSCMPDKEMVRFVQEYLDYVLSFEDKRTLLFTEERVDFSNIVPEGFGTMDAAVLNYDTGTCHIFDLKYGQGVKVYAENNTQAQMYALGLFNELECLDVIKSFNIHIVQPRMYHFESWEIDINDLIKFGEYAKERAELALSENPERIAGDKQCRWCAAKSNCPALLKFTEETIMCEFENLDAVYESELTDKDIKLILDNKKLIEDFLKAVEDKVYNRLIEGGKLEGYKLVEGRSTRKWIDEAENHLIDKLGDDAFEKKLIGITKAGKLMDKKDIDDLTFKPEGKPTLAKESDKRKAIANIKDQFENLED